MTVETTDPVVAVVYAVLAYPSLRPGVTTATDLVDGQPGPWTLADEDRAALAEQLVARLGTRPADTQIEALAEMVGETVIDACRTARQALTDYWTDHRDTLPKHLCHEIETIEGRLVDFIDANPLGLPTPTATPPATAPTTPAPAAENLSAPALTADTAPELRSDQWIVLLRRRGLAVPEVMAELRARAEAAGKVAPVSLRDVQGNPFYAGLLISIADAATEAKP